MVDSLHREIPGAPFCSSDNFGHWMDRGQSQNIWMRTVLWLSCLNCSPHPPSSRVVQITEILSRVCCWDQDFGLHMLGWFTLSPPLTPPWLGLSGRIWRTSNLWAFPKLGATTPWWKCFLAKWFIFPFEKWGPSPRDTKQAGHSSCMWPISLNSPNPEHY